MGNCCGALILTVVLAMGDRGKAKLCRNKSLSPLLGTLTNRSQWLRPRLADRSPPRRSSSLNGASAAQKAACMKCARWMKSSSVTILKLCSEVWKEEVEEFYDP